MKDEQSQFGDKLCQHDLGKLEAEYEELQIKIEINPCSSDDRQIDLSSLTDLFDEEQKKFDAILDEQNRELDARIEENRKWDEEQRIRHKESMEQYEQRRLEEKERAQKERQERKENELAELDWLHQEQLKMDELMKKYDEISDSFGKDQIVEESEESLNDLLNKEMQQYLDEDSKTNNSTTTFEIDPECTSRALTREDDKAIDKCASLTDCESNVQCTIP